VQDRQAKDSRQQYGLRYFDRHIVDIQRIQ
jgi:hypothetical protein